MKIYSKTDVGKKRYNNQDSFTVGSFDNGAVFAVVCDGMGGANGGNIASQMAIKIISDYIINSYSPKMNSNSIENMLRAAVDTANFSIYERSKSDNELSGMGTTVVATLICDNLVHIVHVGDSRAYLATSETLDRLTVDHSLVQKMINNGEISEEEAFSHPKKNVITRAVGTDSTVISDYNIAIKPENNVVLICTDGLTNLVNENEICNTIRNVKPEECADILVNMANENGGSDNITVVLIY